MSYSSRVLSQQYNIAIELAMSQGNERRSGGERLEVVKSDAEYLQFWMIQCYIYFGWKVTESLRDK